MSKKMSEEEAIAMFDTICNKPQGVEKPYRKQIRKKTNIVYSDAEIDECWKDAIFLFEKAVNIVNNYLEKLRKEGSEEKKYLIKDLEFALRILNQGFEFYKSEKGRPAIVYSANKYDRGNRPGMGLSRGFGEIYYNDKEMEGEIRDAISDIERYFNAM